MGRLDWAEVICLIMHRGFGMFIELIARLSWPLITQRRNVKISRPFSTYKTFLAWEKKPNANRETKGKVAPPSYSSNEVIKKDSMSLWTTNIRLCGGLMSWWLVRVNIWSRRRFSQDDLILCFWYFWLLLRLVVLFCSALNTCSHSQLTLKFDVNRMLSRSAHICVYGWTL